MTAVLIVLSLLVFAAGLVAWAVHMHGVWASEANWAARRRVSPDSAPPTTGTASDAEADNSPPMIAESTASTDDAALKEARP